MPISVGIVCEGSHDFNVLQRFVRAILAGGGYEAGVTDCLQPEISASFQVGAGGWAQVKAWCEADGGQRYRKYIDQPIFAASKIYDLIIVHLDGDVVSHCEAPPLIGLDIATMGVANVVTALQNAVLQTWMTLDPAHIGKVVACVPVQQLEAWLAAGVDAAIRNPETRPMKDEFRRGAARKFRGTPRDIYIRAADIAVGNIGQIRAACQSYRRFERDLTAAAAT